MNSRYEGDYLAPTKETVNEYGYYPRDEGLEENVEYYGNFEAEKILYEARFNKKEYIDELVKPDIGKKYEEETKTKDNEREEIDR